MVTFPAHPLYVTQAHLALPLLELCFLVLLIDRVPFSEFFAGLTFTGTTISRRLSGTPITLCRRPKVRVFLEQKSRKSINLLPFTDRCVYGAL